MKREVFRLVLVIGVLLLVSGCGLKFTITDTPASNFTYAKADIPKSVLTVVDLRKGDDAQFIAGRIGLGGTIVVSDFLELKNMEDPMKYLSVNLEKELSHRGIPIKCVVGKTEGQGLTLLVNQYQIVNFRLTGFSPWESSHVFSGTLVANGKKQAIRAYFYNGKMPVWSMDDIAEPCFNTPVSIMVKDIASKINNIAFCGKASDASVQGLNDKIAADLSKKEFTEACRKVVDLGAANNNSAMKSLKKYVAEKDELFKSCALDAIGILNPGEEFDFLKQSFINGSYNDKYMAIKAIGDIGTPEALKFIQDLKRYPSYNGEGGFKTVVDLYLR